jgi:hypothetical protein
MGDWYSSGFDGAQQEKKRIEASKSPRRLWLPVGVKKEVVLVDDEPIGIHEHNPKINGRFNNPITCIQGTSEDLVCCQKLGPNTRYYVGYFTGVDCSEWTDKQGVVRRYEMYLIPAKMQSLDTFQRKKNENNGSIAGGFFKVHRDAGKTPSIGNEWELQRIVDDAGMAKLFELTCYLGEKLTKLWDRAENDAEVMERLTRTFKITPVSGKLPREIPSFNYLEVLKPMTPKELRLFLGAVDKSEPGKPSGSEDYESDDVPF